MAWAQQAFQATLEVVQWSVTPWRPARPGRVPYTFCSISHQQTSSQYVLVLTNQQSHNK